MSINAPRVKVAMSKGVVIFGTQILIGLDMKADRQCLRLVPEIQERLELIVDRQWQNFV